VRHYEREHRLKQSSTNVIWYIWRTSTLSFYYNITRDECTDDMGEIVAVDADCVTCKWSEVYDHVMLFQD